LGYEIVYCYDANGSLIGFTYETATTRVFYRYVLNAQGDVIALLDENYNIVVKYTYDTWGKVLSVTNASGTLITDTTHIGHRNPIRYRGYYYDVETELYYLQSRYYDPEVGRFISADAFAVLGATPMDVQSSLKNVWSIVTFPATNIVSTITSILDIIKFISFIILS
jgi:RHS repeat-associated protein